ncbi:MAG TPA: lactate utilization protein [Phototrophicaceae bacterium]|jgi:L-lactate utilization protein LutC|nr:lactate utilization protein [Phototrophicaceae bacterium]
MTDQVASTLEFAIPDYTTPVSRDDVLATAAALKARGINVIIVDSAAEAHEKINELIPAGASIMTGGSKTLQEIGLEARLMAKDHPWVNLKDEILAETDPAKQMQLRASSILAPYFLGSVHAISKTGEVVIASGSGSQIPSYAYSSRNVIWVAGAQKIVPTLEDALRRVREYALPKEDERQKSLGRPGSMITKILIVEHEPAMMGRNLTLILVNDAVGV